MMTAEEYEAKARAIRNDSGLTLSERASRIDSLNKRWLREMRQVQIANGRKLVRMIRQSRAVPRLGRRG